MYCRYQRTLQLNTQMCSTFSARARISMLLVGRDALVHSFVQEIARRHSIFAYPHVLSSNKKKKRSRLLSVVFFTTINRSPAANFRWPKASNRTTTSLLMIIFADSDLLTSFQCNFYPSYVLAPAMFKTQCELIHC